MVQTKITTRIMMADCTFNVLGWPFELAAFKVGTGVGLKYSVLLVGRAVEGTLDTLGVDVGYLEGDNVGTPEVGRLVFCALGGAEWGYLVGPGVGTKLLGTAVGIRVVGSFDGLRLGIRVDGLNVGTGIGAFVLGLFDGCTDEGSTVGCRLGLAVDRCE